MNINNMFPKNYGASGIGLVNLAAFGYSDSERQRQHQKPPAQGLYPALPKLDDFIMTKSANQQNSYSGGPSAPPSFNGGFQMPNPSAPPYPSAPSSGGLPYPTGGSLPYPMGGMGSAPSLPYPTGGMGMPMPYTDSQPSSGYSSMYPSMPSLPGRCFE